MTDNLIKAYEEGTVAETNGKSRDVNPYDFDLDEYDHWNMGWEFSRKLYNG